MDHTQKETEEYNKVIKIMNDLKKKTQLNQNNENNPEQPSNPNNKSFLPKYISSDTNIYIYIQDY